MSTIFTFSYTLGMSNYQMQPGQIATPPIDVTATAIADWWGTPVTDLNGPCVCEFPAGDLASKCQLQLFDLGGQPIPGNRPTFYGGTWQGKIAFRPLGASMVGGDTLWISIKFTAQDGVHNGQGGGTGTTLVLKLAAPAPVTKHAWVASNNGQVWGTIQIPEGQENVQLTRDGALMFPNYHP